MWELTSIAHVKNLELAREGRGSQAERTVETAAATLRILTSAEHYGGVLNEDFDYLRYLEALQRSGFNYTRIFSGEYVEPVDKTGRRRNTLAPAPGRYLAPWMRSHEPGYPGGGRMIRLREGVWKAFWTDPVEGNTVGGDTITHVGGVCKAPIPRLPGGAMALRLERER